MFMKKIFVLFLFISICLTSLIACRKEEKEIDAVHNTIFTDEFFEDVVEIRDFEGTASGEQMKPVIRYLKSLYLVETDIYIRIRDDDGYPLIGRHGIDFEKKDGTIVSIYRTNNMFIDIDGINYMFTSGDLNEGLKAAFEEGLNN